MLGIAAKRASDGGRRIGGVVNVAVRRLGFGRRCGEGAVATYGIRFAGRMQKIFRAPLVGFQTDDALSFREALQLPYRALHPATLCRRLLPQPQQCRYDLVLGITS